MSRIEFRRSPALILALALTKSLTVACGGANPVQPLPPVGPPDPFVVTADFYDGTLTTTVTRDDPHDPCIAGSRLEVGQEYSYSIQVIRAGTMLRILLTSDIGGYNATTDGTRFEIAGTQGPYPCGTPPTSQLSMTFAVTGTIMSDFTAFTAHEVTRQLHADGSVAAQTEFDWSGRMKYRSTGPYTVMPYPDQPVPPPFPTVYR
jgi:hypothetical protein